MYILVNDQKIEITATPKVQRFNSDGHLLLTVFIPKDGKTADEMDALCDYIAENAPVIGVYDGNDEKVQSLEGFKLQPTFHRSKDGATWELSIENSSELEYQYGLLRDRTASLEQSNAEQAKVIDEQAKAITEQATVINNQAKAIDDQAAVIENLNQQLLMVQLAAAELYEQSMAVEEPVEEPTEEPAEEVTEETTEPEAAESEAE